MGSGWGATLLHSNSALLVNKLEALELLDGRFSKLVHVNMPNGEKRGFFSLVFRAYDEMEERLVALKFFDLDPKKQQQYRLLCFKREHEILKGLKGAPRCLQLASPYSTFDLEIPIQGHVEPFRVPANFFATDWLDGDVDDYFHKQDALDPVEKLKVFNEVVLAVESLHSRSVFHRDLKVDNFRCCEKEGKREVVVIDFGTAARVDSQPMLDGYGCPVGLQMYSAPEAFCGFAGNRDVAPFTDMFALGCMLFELFHPDDFPSAYRAVNPDYDVRFSALMTRIPLDGTESERLRCWDKEAPRLFAGLSAVSLSKGGSSAPLAVADLLTSLIEGMTHPNFRTRQRSFIKVREKIWRAIRVLEHVSFQRRKAEIAAARRVARIEKALARARLAERPPLLTRNGVK